MCCTGFSSPSAQLGLGRGTVHTRVITINMYINILYYTGRAATGFFRIVKVEKHPV